MKRREFFTIVSGAVCAWPIANAQQRPKLPRLGVLNPGSAGPPGAVGFYDGLRDLGYVEGLNIAIERRYGDWIADRFHELATELVLLNVDVLVVMSTSPARAAKQATSVIPIAVGGMADPVGDELIESLARPGGNITGNTFLGPELITKRIGLLKDAVPGLSRVAALLHPSAYGQRTMDNMLNEAAAAAQALDLQLNVIPAESPGNLDGAFVAMSQAQVGAFVQLPSPMLYGEHVRIVTLAKQHQLPAMYAAREFVDDGGLMSYGASQYDLFRRLATYVDKILKGGKPADLPIEQPTRLEFVLNLRSAKELHLKIPAQLLAMADEAIE